MKLNHLGQAKLLLPIALAMGLLAAWAAYQYLSHAEQALQDRLNVTYVERLVAAHDLKKGHKLEVNDLALRDYPQDWVHADSFEPSSLYQVQGQYLTHDVQAGQSILSGALTSLGSHAMMDRLQTGKRAVTIMVEHDETLVNLLTPDNLIDLYVSFDFQGKRMTALLLGAVSILANHSIAQASEFKGGIVEQGKLSLTVQVAQEDAAKLIAAGQAGVMTVALSKKHQQSIKENNLDAFEEQHTGAKAVDLATLLGLKESKDLPVAPAIIYGDRLDTDVELSSLRKVLQGMGAPADE
jgi:pilus assembly protein CpaB